MRDSEFISASEGLGSWMEGGFHSLDWRPALRRRQAGNRAVGRVRRCCRRDAAIRRATWNQLPDAALQLATLGILAVREWS